MSHGPSRREFLTASTAAVALATLGSRAGAQRIFERRIEVADTTSAREIALAALDAARDAGATYADVRVDAEVTQAVSVWRHHAAGSVTLGDRFVYGVRVLANGQWGFAGDEEASIDAAAGCARRAVAQARANASLRRRPVVLASTRAVADATWETPTDVDPFTVPVGEQQVLLLDAAAAALRVAGVRGAGGTLRFARTVRTFASTDGSFIVQTLWLTTPSVVVQAVARGNRTITAVRSVRGLSCAGGGYEIVRDARIVDGIAVAAADAVQAAEAMARAKAVDVGRYDVVVSAGVMAGLVAGTLGEATGWSRVSGRDVGYEGISFASPPERALGKAIASPLVTLTGDRVLDGGVGTVAWDDEGVAADAFTLIDRGVLVDYQTTRESAAALAWWYDAQRRPVRSHGCAAGGGLTMPRETMPNLVMRPARRTTARVADMVAGVKRGLLLTDDASGGTDATLASGTWRAPLAQEIRDGKVVGAVRDVGMAFRTRELWMSLDAVGGMTSAESVGVGGATVRAVPGRFRAVPIISSGLVV